MLGVDPDVVAVEQLEIATLHDSGYSDPKIQSAVGSICT